MLVLGEQCSMAERRADEATRDVMAWLKCEYLSDHVGDAFTGVISAVTGFGLFVELKDVYVEGLIHISALDKDFYQFDQAKQRLIGERTRVTFQLGDELVVQVARVDMEEKKIHLSLLDQAPRRARKSAKNSADGAPKKKSKKRPKRGKGKGRSLDDKINQSKTASKVEAPAEPKKKPRRRPKKKPTSAPQAEQQVAQKPATPN